MDFVNTNENNLVIFINGQNSELNEEIFSNIDRTIKAKVDVDYSQSLTEIIHATRQQINKLSCKPNGTCYERVVLISEGYGADIANIIASRLSMRALLIKPVFKQPFLTTNTEDTVVLIDKKSAEYVNLAKENLNDLQKSWKVEYSNTISPDSDVFLSLCELCEDGWSWIDDACWHDED